MLSRAEGITLLLRLAKQVTTGVLLPSLTDVHADHWAARAIAIGLEAGMVGLTEDKQQFLPDAPFTRGDLARAAGILLTQEPNLAQTALAGQFKVLQGKVTTQYPLSIKLKELASNSGLAGRDIEIAVRQVGEDDWITLPEVFTTDQYGDVNIILTQQAITGPGVYEINASFKGEEGILAPSSATTLLKVGEVEFKYFILEGITNKGIF